MDSSGCEHVAASHGTRLEKEPVEQPGEATAIEGGRVPQGPDPAKRAPREQCGPPRTQA